MNFRECPFCGKRIPDTGSRDCPICHETLPERRFHGKHHHAARMTPGRNMIRRGLLYMMCVAAIYYFMSPASPYQIKMPYPSILTTYLLPLFFIMGLGFALYGIYQHVRA